MCSESQFAEEKCKKAMVDAARLENKIFFVKVV
jgi:hypothetical protein